MTFRDKLVATLRRLQPVLDEPGVLVVGSEVPNLLQAGAASTLVVSRDVDVGIPLVRLEAVKRHLRHLEGLVPSTEEPSVYVPTAPALLEVNFLGLDPRTRDASDTYVFEDPDLSLMVFGPLGLLQPGPIVDVDGVRVRLPRTAGLLVEKLLTDRTGEKGARDLLVVAGLLMAANAADLNETISMVRGLPAEARHAIASNLTLLSLMEAHAGMPDPRPLREVVHRLIARLEA